MRNKLKRLKNKRVCVVGTVQRITINRNDVPCACVVGVRLKDTNKILTNHVWVDGHWIDTQHLKVGDTIQFYGLIRKYRKFSTFRGKPVSDYKFSRIRNLKKISYESV